MQSCSLSIIIQILKWGSCNKLFTNWVLVPYQEIQALGFPNSPRKLGLHEKPWACISWYGPCSQLVSSKYSSRIPDICFPTEVFWMFLCTCTWLQLIEWFSLYFNKTFCSAHQWYFCGNHIPISICIFLILKSLVICGKNNKSTAVAKTCLSDLLKTNHGSATVIPLYITGCREEIYSESACVASRLQLIRAIYFLSTGGDIKRYHRLRTVISLVSGFF